jgi:hypothetical protein
VTARQRIAVLAAPLVTPTLLPVFRLAAADLGTEGGWYVGMTIYWLAWCVLFPVLLIGPRAVREHFRQRSMPAAAWLLVALPPLVSLIERASHPAALFVAPGGWVVAAINGVLEEVLWRGCFTALFPQQLRWGVLWPSAWFAVWHLAPGSLLPGSEAMRLVAGAALLGGAFGCVAWRTGSMRWTAVSHVAAGVFQA